jgi:malonyl-CoA decarboxylase
MELQEELPQLKRFVTLSPIPGFKKWLANAIQQKDESLELSDEDKDLIELTNSSDWIKSDESTLKLKPLLMRLCHHYLYREKRNFSPLDPVARFHLGNGALIKQVNWLADTSDNGLKQSAGMLVNYSYQLNAVEENHEAFVNENTVAVSKTFRNYLENSTNQEKEYSTSQIKAKILNLYNNQSDSYDQLTQSEKN